MWTDERREKYKDDGRRYPRDLTDAEWETIRPLLSGYDTLTVDLREMVNACLYLHKTGCQWRYLPKDFGSWHTVRPWHARFRADGIRAEAGALLTRAVRRKRDRAPEPSTGILDAQSVPSGPQCGGRGVDGNTRVKGIKRHVTPLSIRWRIEATFGTQTNRYRRLTRNLERNEAAAEDALQIAAFNRVLRAYSREIKPIA